MTALSVPLLVAIMYLTAKRSERKNDIGTVTLYRKQKRPDGGNELVPEAGAISKAAGD